MTSEELLERLMEEYGDAVLRMCFLYLKDFHLAEDAAQETFLKAMKSYDSFQHISNEKTWLIRIAINCCKNILRTRWFQERRQRTEENAFPGACDQIDELIEKDSLSRAVMALKPAERELILLYYYQELSVSEIAAIVRRKENTIYQQLKRTRKKLKNILLEEGYESEII